MPRCTYTLTVDTAATILALKVALAHILHHLTTLTCRVTYHSWLIYVLLGKYSSKNVPVKENEANKSTENTYVVITK